MNNIEYTKSSQIRQIVKFDKSTLETSQIGNITSLKGEFKYFVNRHEMFLIGFNDVFKTVTVEKCGGTEEEKMIPEVQKQNNWVYDLTTCKLDNIPDCSNPYQETGTLYYDRREMKSYLVGGFVHECYLGGTSYSPEGKPAEYVGTCNEFDIKNKVFS